MSVPISIYVVERFRGLVAQRMGLQFDDSRLDMLRDTLARRMNDLARTDAAAYIDWLSTDGPLPKDEWRILSEFLTVNETYFFRNPDQFKAFAELVIPNCVQSRRGQRQLRILSAGCASGEEAHSIAIAVRDQLPDSDAWDIAILGIDVNPAMIDKARRHTYSTWSLRGMSDELRQRCFKPCGREFALLDCYKKLCSFEERNLAGDDPEFWLAGRFDAIFYRNVTMYFSPELTRKIIARMARSLRSEGYLFLGHAETLRGVSQDFHLRHTHETFYYQRREDYGSIAPPPLIHDRILPAPGGMPLDLVLSQADVSWVDAIQKASERIAVLSSGSAQTQPEEAGALPPDSRRLTLKPDLRLALELLRHEQFGEALSVLQSLPPEHESDMDALLLRAALLTNAGRLDEAEGVCRRLLALDELNSGAHYVMALCREHSRDAAGAEEHDRMAVYLDASFAMPHLHLGLQAKRKGDMEEALRELNQARVLLSREDASRILLFGGGFSRDGLIALCDAERRGMKGADA